MIFGWRWFQNYNICIVKLKNERSSEFDVKIFYTYAEKDSWKSV